MKRFLITSLAMGSLLAGTQDVQAATMNIDTFNTVNNPPSLFLLVDPIVTTDSSTETMLPLSETVGRNRQIDLTYTSLDPFADTEVELISTGSGTFAITNGVGVLGMGANSETVVTWEPDRHLRGYIMNGMFEFGVMDISPLGANVTLRLDISDNGGNTSFSQIALNSSNASSTVSLPFTGFSDPTIFDNVLDSIALTILGSPEHRITLDYVQVSGEPQANATGTPEPSLLVGLLVTAGIVGAEAWSSQRKRHQ